ncbi:MAG: HAMP domain-containing protein, partial [Defluviitoga tunisiensis]
MRNNSVRSRIIRIILIVFVLFGITVIFNINSLNDSNVGLKSYESLTDEVASISEIEVNFFESVLNYKDYLVEGIEKHENSFKNNLSNIKDQIDRLLETTQTASNLLNINNFLSSYEQNFYLLVTLNTEFNECSNEFNTLSESLIQKLLEFDTVTMHLAFYAFSENPVDIVNNINDIVGEYISSKSSSAKNNVINLFSTLKNNLSLVGPSLTKEEHKTVFLQVAELADELESKFNQIIDLVETQENLTRQMEQLRLEILNLLEEQRAQLKEQQDTLGPQLIEKNNRSIVLTIILTVVAFVVAIIMVIYLIRSITKPLLELRNKINQFKEGDLTVDFQVKSKDEIGQMALA